MVFTHEKLMSRKVEITVLKVAELHSQLIWDPNHTAHEHHVRGC